MTLDALKMLLAVCHDRVAEEVREKLRLSYEEVLKADAEARRQKASQMILSIHRLKVALERLQFTYKKFLEAGCKIAELEQMMRNTEREIKLLSLKKNHN